jgi:hypothetical protein
MREPHRALRIVLRVFSALVAVGSLLMIFSGRPLMMRVLLRPPESEVSTLLLFVVREMGGLFLMLSLLLYFASRDPVRNVAIIDAVIVGLVVLALTPPDFSLEARHRATLSGVRHLGALPCAAGDSGAPLLPAAAR